MTDAAWPQLAAFALASLVLAATPGPGVAYIVARTLAQGRRAGLASVAGVALGNLGNALGASLGLAALFAVSPLAFGVVKLAGAAYLVFLGFKALRASRADAPPPPGQAPAFGRILRDGFVVALLNPKTALFFAAFLPQFMQPAMASGMSPLWQSAGFGCTFVAIAATTDTVYVLAAGVAGPALGRLGVSSSTSAALGRWATAIVYFGLGALAANGGPRSAK